MWIPDFTSIGDRSGWSILLPLLVVISAFGCEAPDLQDGSNGDSEALTLVSMGTDCGFHATPIVSLSGPEVDLPVAAVRWGARFLVVGQSSRHRIAVFDSAGSFIRTVGVRGRGPGEFTNIRAVVPFRSDSLLVLDGGNLKGAVFDSEFDQVREFSIPVQPHLTSPVILPDSGFLASGQVTSAEHFGSPIVRLTATGEPLDYYSERIESEGALRGTVLPRAVAGLPDGRVVSMTPIRYELEFWNGEGGIDEVVRREVDWFHWPPDVEDPHFVSAPENRLVDIESDREGLLWVLAFIDGEDWERGVEAGRVVDHAEWVDVAVDVITPEGESVCTVRISDRRVPVGFVGEREILTYEEDDTGRPTVRFWKLEGSYSRASTPTSMEE